MKLLIAIPALDYVHIDFVDCLQKLIVRLKNDGVDFEVKINSGTLVYIARDKLVCHAINNGFTHVLWLDADMVFPDSLLDDLMFSGKDFVTGICHSRRKPYVSCMFKNIHNIERFEEYPNDTFQIAGCGFACVLMTVEILRTVMINNNGKCFLPTAKLSEDLAFCQRVNGQGFEIWCEPTARVGHIGPVTIWPEDGERYRGEILGLDGKKLE